MNQQPDKLFKQKLESYQRPAPANAWSRVEAGLSKKNNKALWLKIAASLLLLSAFIYGVISVTKQNTHRDDVLASQNPKVDSAAHTTESTHENVSKQPLPVEEKKNLKLTQLPNNKTPKVQNNAYTKDVSNDDASKINQPEHENVAQILENEKAVAVSDDDSKVIPDERKNFKLVVEADEVNRKYLKEESIAQATSPVENSSGIKKLLDKAQDLKNNQDPFGDLRQKKNEILALNFQIKKHGQNK